MTTILTLNVAVVVLFAWLSVVKIVPDCATSHLRYRLWRLRDDIVDDVRHGEFDDAERPKKLIGLIEMGLEQAGDLTVLNLGLLHVVTRNVEVEDPVHLQGLSANDAERLGKYRERLADAMLDKAVFGSVSGWLFLLASPVLLIIALVTRRFRIDRRRPSVIASAKQLVLSDFELDNPAHALMSPNGKRRDLHQYV